MQLYNMYIFLISAVGQPAELILRERFKELDCSMEFSDLKYVGTKTSRDHATDFTKLSRVVQEQLNNNSIRAPRKPGIVFKTLQVILTIPSTTKLNSNFLQFLDIFHICINDSKIHSNWSKSRTKASKGCRCHHGMTNSADPDQTAFIMIIRYL